ncbi:hypothetical protein J6590_054543 [Homalodisca vitripennis]|nr:hypothetical protein J6590_054543 [Homalodisca vitripennis]
MKRHIDIPQQNTSSDVFGKGVGGNKAEVSWRGIDCESRRYAERRRSSTKPYRDCRTLLQCRLMISSCLSASDALYSHRASAVATTTDNSLAGDTDLANPRLIFCSELIHKSSLNISPFPFEVE